VPTGSADPYALRRSAIGILNILLERGYRLSVPALVERSLELLAPKLTRPRDQVQEEVVEFIRLRLVNMLVQRNVPADVVEAVLAARFDDPLDAVARVEALAALKGQAGFEPLAVAFKRVGNMVKGGVDTPLCAELLAADCERALAGAAAAARAAVNLAVASGDYAAALQAIAALRAPVDAFFDGVMVMAEQPEVRANRLALLTAVGQLFEGIADFGKINA